MKKLLVTGGSGLLGQALAKRLRPDYRLRSLSLVAADNYDETRVGSVSDPAAVVDAVAGCDAIIHLAWVHSPDVSFEETLEVNYRGTVLLMEEAHRQGVSHVVFASSNHGWGFHPRSAAPLPPTAAPRPDGWYGISKIWGEAVMAFFADACGMTTTSLRIGSCFDDVTDERQTHMWLSFDDLEQLVRLSLARSGPGHLALNAIGECDAPFFDTSQAKAMGFVPKDRALENLRSPEIAGQAPPDGIFGRAMGGSFAAANFRADIAAWESKS